MTSAKLIVFLLCLEELVQVSSKEFSSSSNHVFLVKAGQNLTLTCLYQDFVSNRIYWFKQLPGEKPSLLCNYFISSQSSTFFNNFKNNPRFQLHPDDKGTNLTITDLEISDSAEYYCAKQYLYIFEFIHVFNVVVQGSELTRNQSNSEPIQSEGSGTLNCTAHTRTCDGDHTVYWFKNSGRSQLELVYSHRHRRYQCEKKTNTCFYSLSTTTMNISQTGTYYCAVAACGHILLGNGTKLEFEDKGNSFDWVYFLSAGWIFTIIVVVFLSISIFMAKKKNRHHSLERDSQSRFSAVSRANTEGDQEEDNLHYATVRVNRPNASRTQKKSQNECVYSGVRQ